MAEISDQDLELVGMFVSKGILENIEASDVYTTHGGEILVACSDGNRFFDLFNYRIRLTKEKDINKHITHVIALAGGPLLLPPNSPIYHYIMLDQIKIAYKLKGISHVILYGHTPCSAPQRVAGVHLPADKSIALVLEGKQQILNAFPEIHVQCCYHVDDHGQKSSYKINEEKWYESYRKSY